MQLNNSGVYTKYHLLITYYKNVIRKATLGKQKKKFSTSNSKSFSDWGIEIRWSSVRGKSLDNPCPELNRCDIHFADETSPYKRNSFQVCWETISHFLKMQFCEMYKIRMRKQNTKYFLPWPKSLKIFHIKMFQFLFELLLRYRYLFKNYTEEFSMVKIIRRVKMFHIGFQGGGITHNIFEIFWNDRCIISRIKRPEIIYSEVQNLVLREMWKTASYYLHV